MVYLFADTPDATFFASSHARLSFSLPLNDHTFISLEGEKRINSGAHCAISCVLLSVSSCATFSSATSVPFAIQPDKDAWLEVEETFEV